MKLLEILTCMRAIEPVTTGNDGSEKPLVLVRRNEKKSPTHDISYI